MANQIIDVEIKGNAIRLYVGENGKQWGDDWNDAPYEHNAGTVYAEYVERTVDIAIPFDLYVIEPSDGQLNSSWCKEDMIHRKVAAFWVDTDDYSGKTLLSVSYGDDVDEVLEKVKALPRSKDGR
jgi:hypothetical protein